MPEDSHLHSTNYRSNSLSLAGAIAMGTGVMIGAGIFALTGQVAELAQSWFPLAFVAAAIVAGFSSYSYVKLANAFPSAGGIAMFLEKSYGKGVMTGACALLMYFSMVINESLVARTFATYVLQLFNNADTDWAVPILGVGLLLAAFLVNVLGNRLIETFSFVMAFVKVAGLVLLAAGGLWVSGLTFDSLSIHPPKDTGVMNFLGATALALLAFKGFTTITNSGGEIKDPHRNVGRAIVISIALCTLLYLLVTMAVAGNLSIERIVASKDYALAEAARPAFGDAGVWVTVLFAIAATVSGVIASVFAVSRMLAMLTDMKLVPHRHFGMPGSIQKHTLVYTLVLAALLTAFFDLSRIASLGAIFYILMDIAIHWGVLRKLRKEIQANSAILMAAIGFDAIVLTAFIWVKADTDLLVVWFALGGIAAIFLAERIFLRHEISG